MSCLNSQRQLRHSVTYLKAISVTGLNHWVCWYYYYNLIVSYLSSSTDCFHNFKYAKIANHGHPLKTCPTLLGMPFSFFFSTGTMSFEGATETPRQLIKGALQGNKVDKLE